MSKQLIRVLTVAGGSAAVGYFLMTALTPTGEQFRERAQVDPAQVEQIHSKNAAILSALQMASESKEPLWKMNKEIAKKMKEQADLK
eukprot:m.21843 g.21843  ORF g.21843 m.21843 type:complete len:87 (-) comp7247_c0_seq1:134-394(-)